MTSETHARLHLDLNGSSFSASGTSLHDLIRVYSAVEGIFDSTYLNIQGQDRLSYQRRSEYGILIQDARTGSWNSVLELFVSITPGLFSQGLTIIDYVDAALVSYELLKTVFSLKRDGSVYTVETNGDGNSVTVNQGNGNQIIFNGPVTLNLPENASKILPEIRELADLVKSGAMSDLKLQSPVSPRTMALNSNEAQLFDAIESKSTAGIEIEVELYRYNKRSRTGKMQVLEQQVIPAGLYTFKVQDRSISDDVIVSMLRSHTTVTVQEIFHDDPITNEQKLHSLELVSV